MQGTKVGISLQKGQPMTFKIAVFGSWRLPHDNFRHILYTHPSHADISFSIDNKSDVTFLSSASIVSVLLGA